MLPVKRFFPDPEPGCPDECEEIRDGEDLTACRCSPEFLADLPGSDGVMSAETRGIVGAGKAQGVRIYADRKTHVRKDHPETTANDFLKVQDMLDNGEILTNPGKEADVLLTRKIGDEHYLIPLQVGKRGGNLLSFYRLDQGEGDREKLRKRGKVLRKERN